MLPLNILLINFLIFKKNIMNAGDGMIASIGLFGGNFAPRTYALCEGQLLPISANTALFSILGTTYGGDGRTTFGLPDLRGRVAIGNGNGSGLSPRSLGDRGGEEDIVLTVNQLPAHTHTPTGTIKVADQAGDSFESKGNYLAQKAADVDATPNTTLEVYKTASGATFTNNEKLEGLEINSASVGLGSTINIMQPYLVLNYIIALTGIFPSRN